MNSEFNILLAEQRATPKVAKISLRWLLVTYGVPCSLNPVEDWKKTFNYQQWDRLQNGLHECTSQC